MSTGIGYGTGAIAGVKTFVSGFLPYLVTAPRMIFTAFKKRMLDIPGTTEDIEALEATLVDIEPLTNATLVVTPHGYNPNIVYACYPNFPYNDLSVVRATDKTRVNQAGLIETVPANTPSIDWSTGEPVLLVEEQRTNLALWSSSFDNPSWVDITGSTITPNSGISPSGIQDADKFEDIPPTMYQVATLIVGQTYTLSFYAKSISFLTQIHVFANSFNSVSATTIVPNNFVRATLTFVATESSNLFGFASSFDSYVWGAQLEEGTEATSYIPTTGTAVTRNADIITTTPPALTTEIIEYPITGAPISTVVIPPTYQIPDGAWKAIKMIS